MRSIKDLLLTPLKSWWALKLQFNFGFPGGDPGNQDPARTIAHSPRGVKEKIQRNFGQISFFGARAKQVGSHVAFFNVFLKNEIP